MALTTSPFDAIPEVYDRIRPRYPQVLYDELFARLPQAPDVVEIGPGTGQATVDLLSRGAHVTGVELGPNIAAFLRNKFAGHPGLRVINAGFEAADLSAGSFDLVFCATAFHWIDSAVRLTKTAHLLRPGALLAVVETVQIASTVDRGYFERSLHVYQKYGTADYHQPSPNEHEVRGLHLAEIEASPLFEDVRFRYWRWDQRYTTAEYADLLRSYSGTQMMHEAVREPFIADLCAFIDAEFEGYVVRPLVITLLTGRKRL